MRGDAMRVKVPMCGEVFQASCHAIANHSTRLYHTSRLDNPIIFVILTIIACNLLLLAACRIVLQPRNLQKLKSLKIRLYDCTHREINRIYVLLGTYLNKLTHQHVQQHSLILHIKQGAYYNEHFQETRCMFFRVYSDVYTSGVLEIHSEDTDEYSSSIFDLMKQCKIDYSLQNFTCTYDCASIFDRIASRNLKCPGSTGTYFKYLFQQQLLFVVLGIC